MPQQNFISFGKGPRKLALFCKFLSGCSRSHFFRPFTQNSVQPLKGVSILPKQIARVNLVFDAVQIG